ncbi:MAG: hypothetical protein KR126chlam2_00350 [Chlamydiae bacterium]|nr:hypothetical protein [Chlamydiota bacterium]
MGDSNFHPLTITNQMQSYGGLTPIQERHQVLIKKIAFVAVPLIVLTASLTCLISAATASSISVFIGSLISGSALLGLSLLSLALSAHASE